MTYYGMAEFSRKIVHEAAEQRQSTDMKKYLEEIKDVVNKQIKILASSSSSSTVTSSQDESFSALAKHQQFAIVSTALVRLNTYVNTFVPLLRALRILVFTLTRARGGPVVHKASPAPEIDPGPKRIRYIRD